MHDAGKYVAAIAVRAEPVLGARRLQALHDVHANDRLVIVGNQVGAQGQTKDHRHQQQAEHGELVAAETMPDQRKLAALFKGAVFTLFHRLTPSCTAT